MAQLNKGMAAAGKNTRLKSNMPDAICGVGRFVPVAVFSGCIGDDVDNYTIIFAALAVLIFLRGSIIPIPNVLAGILIGVAVNAWGELLVSCVGWSFAFCAHVWIAQHQRAEFTIVEMETRAHRLLFGSPAMTFYAIEWATALPTSLAVSAVTFIARKMLF